MVIEFILAVIGVFGTLTIVAYLKQVEDGIAELQEQTDSSICPVCLIPHSTKSESSKSMKKGMSSLKRYYNSKRKAAYRYCKRTK